MTELIEVWESRLGVEEITGKNNNATILQWCIDAGHPEIVDDETAWCSTSMCSAAKEAGLPFPPVNVNPMARSWLTMGVRVDPADVQPSDVVVWPRGGPNSGQGHVNCVKDVRKRAGGKIEVRCIGGNQSKKGTNGAVTLTDWVDLAGALPNGVRRLVPPTVKALRQAGSTTIAQADDLQKVATIGVATTPVIAGLEQITAPVQVPATKVLPEALGWWQATLDSVAAIWAYLHLHPYLGVVVLAAVTLALWAHKQKQGRVAEHAAGIPIAAEVARLQEA